MACTSVSSFQLSHRVVAPLSSMNLWQSGQQQQGRRLRITCDAPVAWVITGIDQRNAFRAETNPARM